MLKEFFLWKHGKAPNMRRKEAVSVAYETVMRKHWSVKDLVEMADVNSILYRIASETDIPEGMIRNFKADLHIFKPIYKNNIAGDKDKERVATEALNAMATGGGFIA